MLTRNVHKNVQWLDLASPKKNEIREMVEELSLPLHFGEMLGRPPRPPLLTVYEGKLFFTFYFPLFGSNKTDTEERVQISFVLGDGFVITCHDKPVDVIDKFSKSFEADALLGNSNSGNQNERLLCRILERLYERLENELEGIEDRLDETEDQVFHGGEKKMVYILSEINKDLLDFKQAIRGHQSLFDKFKEYEGFDTGKILCKEIPKIREQYQQIWNTIFAHRETLEELRQTNDSLLSAKTNRVVKTLTIITFATYPSIFLTGLFGMNVTNPPIIGGSFDFWIILLIIFLATSSVFTFFVFKRWF